jgi:hypothetical protein
MQVSNTLLEEHDDQLIIDLQDDIPLFVETLDELLKGLPLLLHDVVQVPLDSWMLAGSSQVTDELVAEV